MSKLKSVLFEEEANLEKLAMEQVEVIGDSLDECLKLAAQHFGKAIYDLDYEVIKRGKKKLFFSEPFHIRAFLANHEDNLDDLKILDEKLTGGSGKLLSKELKDLVVPKDVDGRCVIKVYRSGVYLAVFPPFGNGRRVKLEEALKKFSLRGVNPPKEETILKIINEANTEFIRVSDTPKLKPFNEAQVKIEIAPDKMKALATIIPPKPGGRDLSVEDVVLELKRLDISYGIQEALIKQCLDEEIYNEPFPAAIGDQPMKGADAYIKYHVRTERKIHLKEDASGKVNYKDLDLIENVTVGQLLAEKIPAEKGKYGRTLFGEMLEAKDGEDVVLHQGKGTILSEDKTKLTAEVNGQVLFLENKLTVETIYRVNGDVGMKTGNITFLGSVVVTGNVEDNFSIKASGHVEIYGTVQKSVIEADGDIVIRQGVAGKGEARIESTNGNIIARFIQDANVSTDKSVLVQEVIMSSKVSAGEKIVCSGKKAQIVGGRSIAGQAIIAKNIGSKADTTTEIIVGYNPKFIRQIDEYKAKKNEGLEKLEQLQKTYKTLIARKEADPASYTKENMEYQAKLEAGMRKLEKRIAEYQTEIQKATEFMEQNASQGKIYFEKKLYPGVKVRIKSVEFVPKNEIKGKILYLDNNLFKQRPYMDPEKEAAGPKKKPVVKKEEEKPAAKPAPRQSGPRSR